MMHNFNISKARASRYEDAPEYAALCRQFYPGLDRVSRENYRMSNQFAGIDVWLFMQNGYRITVDNKFREEVWDDVLLEFVSDAEQAVPGWVCKPGMRVNFILYVFTPIWKGILIPRAHLQNAWAELGDQWCEDFSTVEAHNQQDGRYWTTRSCPVPISVLCDHVRGVKIAQI